MQRIPHLTTLVVILLAISIPLFFAVSSLITGHVTLWYDPARDLLSAWANLSKPTLIGPTSGIPGIFYGPYWIWLLSTGLLVSKDPLLVTFITATLPYFILFPLLWFGFRRFFGLPAVIIGWLFFMLTTGMTYATQLWNPYPAPLLTIALVAVLIRLDFERVNKAQVLLSVLAGFLLGLVIQFHISFGIGLLCGVGLFLGVDTLLALRHKAKRKQHLLARLTSFTALAVGFGIAYLPTLLFEVRHGFHQIQTLLHTFTQFGAVVALKGLSKPEIAQEFLNTLGKLVKTTPTTAGVLLMLSTILLVILTIKKRVKLSPVDRRILILITSLFAGIMLIYFTARNPVWAYHFIGVDVLFLLLVTFLLGKIPHLDKLAAVWVGGIVFTLISTYSLVYTPNYHTGFYGQKEIAQTVARDAKGTDYTVYAYSPSIYIYEYSYLFKWLADKDVPYDPSANPPSNTQYLIVPSSQDAKVQDFINFRSPTTSYTTKKTWNIGGDKTILKRVKK